ncbi:hypothetical protein DSM104443_01657 [Usitatibacter rugosus]|uniref:Heavy-metal resistance protein n=1 Tax=Usitatibacter rugosus TaxID=2732067 RepID=A0A6M4GW68_9PROT|nr:hypothetical protein [Usitatibacter rugosus]QJR10593.1 hypothetical protein DSM104443_01657 [Usitatibacter rugosus]
MATLRRSQRGQALIIIFLGTLLIGGAMGGSSGLFHTGQQVRDLRERANNAIQDDLRREAVSRTFDAIETDLKSYTADRTALEKDAFVAFENHGATRADFEILFARADGLNAKARETFLSQREALRARINAEEWVVLWTPPKTESVEAFKSYGEKQGN